VLTGFLDDYGRGHGYGAGCAAARLAQLNASHRLPVDHHHWVARQPALDVTLSDAAGRPICGANITYLFLNALSASKNRLRERCLWTTHRREGQRDFPQVAEGMAR
jgi:hypothetical protein